MSLSRAKVQAWRNDKAVTVHYIRQVDWKHELRSNMDTTYANIRVVCVGKIIVIMFYVINSEGSWPLQEVGLPLKRHSTA